MYSTNIQCTMYNPTNIYHRQKTGQTGNKKERLQYVKLKPNENALNVNIIDKESFSISQRKFLTH